MIPSRPTLARHPVVSPITRVVPARHVGDAHSWFDVDPLLALWAATDPKLATIGACLSVYGATVAVGDGDGMNQLNASGMVGSGVDRVQMVALLERLDTSPVIGFFYMTSGLSFLVGGILLGIALLRTADVPRWAGPLLGVSLAPNCSAGALAVSWPSA